MLFVIQLSRASFLFAPSSTAPDNVIPLYPTGDISNLSTCSVLDGSMGYELFRHARAQQTMGLRNVLGPDSVLDGDPFHHSKLWTNSMKKYTYYGVGGLIKRCSSGNYEYDRIEGRGDGGNSTTRTATCHKALRGASL